MQTRRDILTLPPRIAVAYWVGKLFGGFSGKSEIKSLQNDDKGKKNENKKGEDKKNDNSTTEPKRARLLREAYEARQATKEVTAGTVTFGALTAVAAVANHDFGNMDSQVDAIVPVEDRPSSMTTKDEMYQVSRRRILKGFVVGAIVGGIGGPLATRSPGKNLAEEIHGAESENETLEQRAERQITVDRENRRSVIANSLGIGGATASLNNIAGEAREYNRKSRAIHKSHIKQSLEQEGTVTFKVDNSLGGHDLRTLFSKSLEVPDVHYGVNITNRRSNKTQVFSLVYSRDKFCVKEVIGGAVNDRPVKLKFRDEVTITKA